MGGKNLNDVYAENFFLLVSLSPPPSLLNLFINLFVCFLSFLVLIAIINWREIAILGLIEFVLFIYLFIFLSRLLRFRGRMSCLCPNVAIVSKQLCENPWLFKKFTNFFFFTVKLFFNFLNINICARLLGGKRLGKERGGGEKRETERKEFNLLTKGIYLASFLYIFCIFFFFF